MAQTAVDLSPKPRSCGTIRDARSRQPASWFLRADGTVWNLKDIEGELVDFDLEIEDGFELKID